MCLRYLLARERGGALAGMAAFVSGSAGRLQCMVGGEKIIGSVCLVCLLLGDLSSHSYVVALEMFWYLVCAVFGWNVGRGCSVGLLRRIYVIQRFQNSRNARTFVST